MSWQHVVLTEFGGPEVLRVEAREALPEPGPGEVRVKVLAAGTGFTDTLIRAGQYPGIGTKPPFVPGYEWFGVVDAVGPGVENLSVGQHVADMSVIGGYTQVLVAPADEVIAAPDGLNPTRAVAMMLSYSTAYQMLTRLRALTRGASVLIHAAGGATGTALLDCARALGLTAYATGSPAKHEMIRRYGGIPIDYRSEDFVARIAAETDGRGVDAVFDPIGGRHFDRSRQCLTGNGLLVIYGAMHLTSGEESVPRFLWGLVKHLGLKRVFGDGREASFFHIDKRRQKHPDAFRQDVQDLFAMLARGEIDPAIAAVEPLDQAADVHRRIEDGDVAGKIVLDCR